MLETGVRIDIEARAKMFGNPGRKIIVFQQMDAISDIKRYNGKHLATPCRRSTGQHLASNHGVPTPTETSVNTNTLITKYATVKQVKDKLIANRLVRWVGHDTTASDHFWLLDEAPLDLLDVVGLQNHIIFKETDYISAGTLSRNALCLHQT